MKGMTLTHNHPSNSTFSGADLSLLVNRDLKSIRVTGKNRTYQLTKIKGNFPRDKFAKAYEEAYNKNKIITDKEYNRIKRYQKIDKQRYENECKRLNMKLNELNHEWLKENSKKFGYRYGVIERKK